MIRAVVCLLILFASSAAIRGQGALVASGGIDGPDPQTGYFRQPITITNPGATNYSGIRVLVQDLPKDTETNIVRVANAHGLTTQGITNNIPYFDFGPIAAGASVDFTVEYYISNRRTKPNPRYEVLIQVPPQLQLASAFVANTNATKFTNGVFYAEFLTQRERVYYVQYSSSLTSTNWMTSQPGILGNGAGVQWIDSGPPRTESKPIAVGQRFYRVVVLP